MSDKWLRLNVGIEGPSIVAIAAHLHGLASQVRRASAESDGSKWSPGIGGGYAYTLTPIDQRVVTFRPGQVVESIEDHERHTVTTTGHASHLTGRHCECGMPFTSRDYRLVEIGGTS